MTKDAYWDELGVAWCAVNPEADIILPPLKERLRRQSLLITAGLVLGLPLGGLGVALGLYTLAIGWQSGAWFFVTRGTAIILVSGLVLYGWMVLKPVGVGAAGRALPYMLRLAIARLERFLAVARLGLYACGVTAAFGPAGMVLRMEAGKPMQGPLLLYLTIIVLCAAGLFFHASAMRTSLARYRHLQQTLDAE
ncbi:MAG TPA: hypothetical protein VJS85_01695 [Rhizomicrobium sp.]|nr:hypothetical protein [Rhizomicrobium sp.]